MPISSEDLQQYTNSGPITSDTLAQYLNPDAAGKRGADQSAPGIGRTALDQSLQGATWGFSDEVADRIGALIASHVTGEDYNSLLKEARANSKQRLSAEMQDHPVVSIGSNIGGALLTGGALGSTKEGAAVANSLRSGGTAARIGKAALAGSTSGGLYGAGSADDGDRLMGAGKGALVGGAIGGAIPAVGAAYRGIVKPTAGKVASAATGVKNLVLPGEAGDAATRKIIQRLQDSGMTPQDLQTALQNAPGGTAAIDVGGENLQRLGEAVANIPGESAQTAKDFVTQRAEGATQRIKGNIGQYVSSGGDLSTLSKNLIEKGSKEADPLYEAAYKANPDMQSPVLDRILQTDAGKEALSYAANRMNNKMALMGTSDPELVEQAQLAGQYITGQGGISKGLNLRSWNFIKRGLDDQASALARQGEKGAASDIGDLARGLRNELDRLDVTGRAGPKSFKIEGGAYAQARKVWSGMSQSEDTLQAGLDFLKLDTSELKSQFQNLSTTDREMFKIGIAQQMRDAVESAPDRTNIAKRIFGREEIRNKLQAILPQADYDGLKGSMLREDQMHLLNTRLTENSRTALRASEIADLTQDPTDLLMNVVQKPTLTGIANKGLGMMAKTISDRYQGLNRETSGEIARILFETDPQKQQQAILRLQRAAASGNRGFLQGYKALQTMAQASKAHNLNILPSVIAGRGSISQTQQP